MILLVNWCNTFLSTDNKNTIVLTALDHSTKSLSMHIIEKHAKMF